MKIRTQLIIGLLFIAAGTLLGFGFLKSHFRASNPSLLTYQSEIAQPEVQQAKTQTALVTGKPSRIVIPSVKIDISVIDGFYNNQTKTWTLTKDKAQYATITNPANNQEGNTFIYGHNRKEVFNRLSKINANDEVTIYTDSGHVFTYRFRSSYETNPNDSTLFAYKGAPILTLQTCSGLWYQNRQLFTFDLVKVV